MHCLSILLALMASVLASSQSVEELQLRADKTTAIVLPPTPTITGFDMDAALASVRAMATKGGFLELHTANPLEPSQQRRELQQRDDNSGCGACQPQPTIANYYKVKLDTPNNFIADKAIIDTAVKAVTPKGYDQVYSNLKSASNSYLYLGYEVLDRAGGYNPDFCAARCNSISGCAAFNIYFERDPIVDPCSDKCVNPSAFANLKCVYWGSPLSASSAVVGGQWRRQFMTVFAGSNAYINSTVLLDSAYKNEFLNDAAIKAPNDCQNTETYMGYVLFKDTPFDVRLCAAACTARTKYNRSQNNPRACNFWNTYMLLQDGIAQGQFCSLYTASWDLTYATNKGFTSGSQHFTISNSYIGTNTSFVPVCPSSPGFA